jgi:hypothetical protein
MAIYYGDSDTGPLETGGDFYNFFVLGLYPASYDPVQAMDSSEELTSRSEDDSSPTTDDDSASTTDDDSTPTPASTAESVPDQPSWQNAAYPKIADIEPVDFGLSGGGFLSGYFLNESSIGVLSIPSFEDGDGSADAFSQTIADFITASQACGMTKILIDLQQNYGGDVLLAIDTFKQFFPPIEPYGGSQLRAHSSADIIGDALTNYWNNLTVDDTSGFYYSLYASEWVSSNRIDISTNQEFASWGELFDSATQPVGGFTNIVSDVLNKEIAGTNILPASSKNTIYRTLYLIRFR